MTNPPPNGDSNANLPPAPQYADAQYPGQPQQPPQKTNTLAIIALISSFFISVLGIVLGHIALSQIKKTGEGGRGLALAGTIIGYVATFGWLVFGALTVIGLLLFTPQFEAELQRQLELTEQTEQQQPESSEELDGAAPFDAEEEFGTPWVGTENEPFCEVFMVEPEMGEEEAQLQALPDAAPGEELGAKWDRVLELWHADGTSEAELNEFWDLYEEAFTESWDLCLAGS